MSYIEVKIAKQASRKQERVLTEKLGKAIALIPGETQESLMISISSDEHLYQGGDFLEYGAYVRVILNKEPSKEDCQKLNVAVFQIMKEDLKIPEENIYVSFSFSVYTGAGCALI